MFPFCQKFVDGACRVTWEVAWCGIQVRAVPGRTRATISLKDTVIEDIALQRIRTS